MGVLRDLLLTGIDTPDLTAQENPRTTTPGYFYTYPSAMAQPMSENEAMQVPAVSRSVNLVTGIIGSFGLNMYDETTNEEIEGPEWLKQADPRMSNTVLIGATVRSLMLYGLAYWEVLEVFPGTDRPSRMAYVNNQRVLPTYSRDANVVAYYDVDGARRPNWGVGSLITFQGNDEGALTRGKLAIRRGYELINSALVYAQNPSPTGLIKNNGADMPQAEVLGLLNQWKNARRTKAVGYLSQQFDWIAASYSPVEMALNEQIDNADSQIAALFNLDPYWVNAQKSSMTYSNVRDVNRMLYQTTLRYYMDPIESRLNFTTDLCVPGFKIKFDLDDFLRSTPLERVQIEQTLFQNGVISVEEWRYMEDLAPRGSNPTETELSSE